MHSIKNIKSNRQLFIDDLLIEKSEGVQWVMNPPNKKGAVITQDRPWRSKLTGYFGTVLEDNGIYKMWTNCGEGENGPEENFGSAYGKNRYVQYLTSLDGEHWESPNVGQIDCKGSRSNNLVIKDDNYEGSVFIDPNAAPESKYKLLAHRNGKGLFLHSSPDGIRWNIGEACVMRQFCDSQNVVFWDESIRKYVCYFRGWEKEVCDSVTGEVMKPPARNVVRAEVGSFAELKAFERDQEYEKPKAIRDQMPTVLRCDDLDPENTDIYTNAAVKYPLAEDVYLAFPSLYRKFQIYSEKNWKRPRNEGILGTQMAVGRDGITWDIIRKPYIPTGPVGEIDSASTYMHTGMLIKDTEILQYHWGSAYTHGSEDIYAKYKGVNENAVFAVSQRIDGFMSLDSEYTGGSMVTKPFLFEGEKLILNINTSAWGTASVAMLDERQNPVEGLAPEDCDIVRGNYINKTVSWKGNADVSRLRGKPVRLRFDMKGVKLYSFRFE